ncbi:MAG: hypothetical protein DCC65_11085 [Planctomycetota bacterium]|nr:MAG: hypothetical protein DCC65_11085 [Planctomycetota bacterium]
MLALSLVIWLPTSARGLTDHITAGASATSQPAATQPTTAPTAPPEIATLVRRLADRSFQAREEAQRMLATLGPDATKFLAPYITDPDPEVAARIAALVGTPDDPDVRIAVALRLIESTDPDWMERGVHMLFAEPGKVHDAFMRQTRETTGIRRIIFEPIREQMTSWKRQDDLFQRNYARAMEKDPARAEQLKKSHADTRLYCAEAAYWGAFEAMMEEKEHERDRAGAEPTPTTRPGP